MKKYLIQLLFALLPGILLAQTMEFRIDTTFVIPGDSVVIPVRVKNFVGAGSATVYLDYNPTVLSFGRALDWHPQLQGSIHLASAVNGKVAIVWADINGASIPDDVFINLKFRFNGGSTSLAFASNSEVTDIWGSPINPTPVYIGGLVRQILTVTATVTPSAICLGGSSALHMQITGGQGVTVFHWVSDPPGFSSTIANPVVAPTETTTYSIIVSDEVDTTQASVTLVVYPLIAPDPVTNMQPLNGAANVTFPVLFSWSTAFNASKYSMAVWELGNPANIFNFLAGPGISRSLNGFLVPGKTYQWQVVSINPCLQTVGPVQQFTMALLPDLVVQNVQVPPTAFSGQTISISYVIKNQGAGSSANNTWNDRVYLSFDNELQTGVDHFVGTFSNLSALEPGESYTRSINTTLPQGISGNYFVLILTGDGITYPEAIASNNLGMNTTPMLISLSPTPDLQVTQIVMPDNAFSGQQLSLSWSVENQGDAPTAQSIWRDRIFFSADTFFTASATILGTFVHSGILAEGESYNKTQTLTIPPNIFGTFYIHVLTDVFNQVYEHALEGNNAKVSAPLNVFLTPPADLVPTQLNIPAFASNGEIFPITYTVFNDGANAAKVEGGWVDSVYISPSPILNTFQAIKIGYYRRNDPLPAGESYTRTLNCKVPSGLSGQHYIHVFSDALQQIFEFDMEENNIKNSQAILIKNPDLVTTGISHPDSAGSGTQIQIFYHQKNNGPGLIPASLFFRDSVLISTSPVYDTALMTGFGIKSFSGTTLRQGDSIARAQMVTLPHGLDGDFYLYLQSDSRNNVTEGTGEFNNVARSPLPIHMKLTPWPDLVVTSITLEADTLFAGSNLNLSYTVVNNGPGAVVSPFWKDNVCISASPFGPFSHLFQVNVNVNVVLNPGATYTQTVKIPLLYTMNPGPYFLYVYADSNQLVYEHGSDANNLLRSDPFWVETAPPTDLIMLAVTSADTVKSGYPMQVEWTVKNLSPADSRARVWEDKLYFSDDMAYEPDQDHLIGIYTTNSSLAGNASYTRTLSFTTPNGISGNYYLLAVTDPSNSNQDPNISNNVKIRSNAVGDPLLVHVEFTAPADLATTDFNAPDSVVTGQDFLFNWTVTNQGTGNAYPASWTDKLYLSSNAILSPDDILLGGKSRTGGLAIGESYSQVLSVPLPYWASGNYVLLMASDANNQIFEGGAEANNISSRPFQAVMPAPGDLAVSVVIPPGDHEAGQTATIEWTITNQSENLVSGKMRDLVYFSRDTVWDPGDVLFGSFESTINLGNGLSVSRSLTDKLTNLTPGLWFVIVRTNVTNSIIESNYNNNRSFSDEAFRVTVPMLVMNTWTSDSLKNSEPMYYQLDVPAGLIGETLRVRLKGDSIYGNNEFFIRNTEVPNRAVFDVGFSEPGSGNQELLVPYLLEGTYYLLIYGNTLNGSTQKVELYAEILDFTILSVDAKKGSNTGEITLKMTGSKFTPDMQVFLSIGDSTVQSSDVFFDNTTRVYPTFNLTGVPLGVYNLAASKNCEGTAFLANAFEVIEENEGSLEISLVAPAVSGPGVVLPIRVEFVNAGNVNLFKPTRTAINMTLGPVTYQYSGLNTALSELELFFEEVGGPPDILRPGARGSYIIYSKTGSRFGGNIIGVVKN